METAVIGQATDVLGQRLGKVDSSQWAAPTPCGEWDVRALVNHVVGELLWIPPLLEGKTIAEVGDRFDGDVLGTDPYATCTAAASAVMTAASQPGAQERIVHLSFGDFPGAAYLGQVTSDVIIHSWDLARALGLDDRIDDPLFAFVDSFLTPQIEAWRSGGAFGPAVDPGSDATPQDRLLAQTGRSPAWRPS